MNIYLIDGSSYVYRAYFAIRGLSTSKGLPTNAIYGFTKMLLKILNEKRPDRVAVVFDRPEPTRRHRAFEEYKAQRPKAPDDLVIQLPYIRRIVKAFGIKVIEIPGYEADDILAVMACKLADAGAIGGEVTVVYIVSGDKDLLQIVDERIKMFDPMKNILYDRATVLRRYGLPPERIPELMALTGDTVDNIPGIKGIGEKTALEILKFGSLEEIIKRPELIKKEKLRKAIEENLDSLRLSYELAKIDRNIPISITTEDLRQVEPSWQELLEIFRECEFSSLLKLLPVTATVTSPLSEVKTETLRPEDLISLKINDIFAFDLFFERDLLKAIALISDELTYYIPLRSKEDIPYIKALFEDERTVKIGHDLKREIVNLRRHSISGEVIKGRLEDVQIASYLLNPLRPNHDLEDITIEYLGIKKMGMEERWIFTVTSPLSNDNIKDYICQNAWCKLQLYKKLSKRITEEGLDFVYNEIEMPLVRVLADMELTGIKIDIPLLKNLSKELSEELDALRKKIYLLAGEEFNINSPKQLSSILFERLGLKPKKRTKRGYSTEWSILEDLAKKHELPREIINYRTLFKLKSTYVDALPSLVNPHTGRLHTTFNQTITATGRLSSSEPNLQNIPARGEWAERIREAFVAEEGFVMLSADYSQIELRILAHMSEDEVFLKAFHEDLDIHSVTASELFGVEPDRIGPEERRVAKVVNFGIIYGMSSFGLSETLGIERSDAQEYIDRFFARHPGVREFTASLIRRAEEKGYAETLFGRKRPIPELKSRNPSTRSLGERLAINSPIQGTASDIIKLAMIRIWDFLKKNGLRSRILLQIHDELLFEVHEEELSTIKSAVRDIMENVVKLKVPLKVNISLGKNWAEAG